MFLRNGMYKTHKLFEFNMQQIHQVEIFEKNNNKGSWFELLYSFRSFDMNVS